MKQREGWRISCDVGEVTERLENEQSGSPGELSEELVRRRFERRVGE